ncbi:MAG: hypothetical protein U0V02_02515 [Anaerolineales bacterium]
MNYREKWGGTIPKLREALVFGSVYFFVALINLRLKLLLTPRWFNGRLAGNHAELLAFQYANNEQSRLLQFYIPEALSRLFRISIENAYLIQRGFFIFLVMLCFHFYLRKWFDAGLAFGGVLFFIAIMPLSYMNDLQESTPLLLLTFLLALWAIRDGNLIGYGLAMAVGALNNETMLILPFVFVVYNFKSFRFKDLLPLVWPTLLTSLPAYLIVGVIRYITRDNPRLAVWWQFPENIASMKAAFESSPLGWWKASFLFVFFLFGVFWIFTYLRYSQKPLFLQRASLLIPVFVLAHLFGGVIGEVRLMLPLSFIIIPMSFFYLFPVNLPTQQLE